MGGPSFICPGAQKAGTTWLHQRLKRHPNFWMPPQKELDYLAPFPESRRKHAERFRVVMDRLEPRNGVRARAMLEWWRLFVSDWTLEKYRQLFAPAGDLFSGDVSPSYSSMTAEEVQRAAEIVPDAKIVLLLRDPVERAWSHARHAVTRGPKNDLPDADRVAAMVQFALSKKCLANGDYVRIAGDWSAAFGPDRVHLAFYDDLVTRPVELMNGILAFLGAPPMPPSQAETLHEVANQGQPYACPPELRRTLQAHYQPMIDVFRTQYPSLHMPAWAAPSQPA